MIDRLHVGAVFRAIRVEQRLRQVDVARRGGVSRQTVSRLERGRFDGLSLDAYIRIADALDAEVPLVPRFRGSRVATLRDRRHAEIQNAVAAQLRAAGWTVVTEHSFNHFGERGSVDVLAWHPVCCALGVFEIKSYVDDLQETEHRLDIKARVVPTVVRRESGWKPRAIGVFLVVPDTTRNRRVIADHEAMVEASLPARTIAIRRWLDGPDGPLRGVWFFRNARQADTTQKPRGAERVRLTEDEARRANRRRR